MKRGDIVRRKLRNGVPVGAYMMVRSILNDDHVLAQPCEVNMIEKSVRSNYYLIRSLYTPKLVKMPIQDAIWERLNTGRQIAIIHDPTPLWEKMRNFKPDLVEIRSVKYPQKRMTFVVDEVSDCYYNRTRQIRLTLGYRIL